jgi:heptosyltransferase-2
MSTMKILVRLPNWVGDAVLALPALDSIRRAYPEAEIWAAGPAWIADLLPRRGAVAGVIPAATGRGAAALKASARELRSRKFDLGILFTNSFGSALELRLARIPERWGYARDGRGFLLTRRIPAPAAGSGLHQAVSYLNLLARLGLDAGRPEPRLEVEPEDAARADEMLRRAGRVPGRPFVVLGPGAAYGTAKRWPAARFIELGVRLQREADAEIVLVGTAGEESLSAGIAAGLVRPALDFTGRTTLRELAALLGRARLVVINDTGPMHIANALGVPVVAVFGPTDPAATGPLRTPAAVLKKDVACWPCLYRTCPYDHRCMIRIEAAEAFEAGRRFL